MPERLNPQLHIAVCDDERIDREQAAALTCEILAAEGLTCDISAYESSPALLAAIQSGAQFHILLLDVMMDGLDGIELAAALRELGDGTAIIFISSNREMALRGYEVSAAWYLAKPLQQTQLRKALLYCYKTFCVKREILLPTTRGQRRIPLSDILYAEAMERMTKLALTDRLEKINIKFSDLSALLPERQFVFCHRSYLSKSGVYRLHTQPGTGSDHRGNPAGQPVSAGGFAKTIRRLFARLTRGEQHRHSVTILPMFRIRKISIPFHDLPDHLQP